MAFATLSLTLFVCSHGAGPGFSRVAAHDDGNRPVPVILDTDIGDDIDDTWALAMLLNRPEVDLKLIVTTRGDTIARARLVAKILSRIGRTDIPIGLGIRQDEAPINQAEWLGDFDLKDYAGNVIQDGVQAIIDCVEQQNSAVTILAIGPQTNLAGAVARGPAIAQKSRVVAMAGSIFVGYGGRPEPSPEVNIVKDIAAAQRVLESSWEITWAPLDVCGTLTLDEPQYERIRRSRKPAARVVVENYAQWANRSKFPGEGTSILYDTSAAYLAFDETFCRLKTIRIRIDSEGHTLPDDSGRPVRCALEWADRNAFEQLLVDTLAPDQP